MHPLNADLPAIGEIEYATNDALERILNRVVFELDAARLNRQGTGFTEERIDRLEIGFLALSEALRRNAQADDEE